MQLLKTTRAVCNYSAEKGMMVELEVFDYDMDRLHSSARRPMQRSSPLICAPPTATLDFWWI